MLIYHPAFDIYNCVFRILQLLVNMKTEEVETDRIRIWDFYLIFPNEVRKIKFPNDLKDLRKIFKQIPDNPYEDLVDSRKVIERMKSYQLAALKCLASYGFVDSDQLNKGIVKRTAKEIPSELLSKIHEADIAKQNIIKLVTGFYNLPLYGQSGLKQRTGLLDFRYDPK